MKNLDKNLLKILKEWEETPSPRCWESIESQLSGLPTPSLNDNIKPTSSSSALQKGASFLGKSTSFWVKTAIVAAATTAAVYTLVKIASTEENATVEPQEMVIDNKVVETDSVERENDTLPLNAPLNEKISLSENKTTSAKATLTKNKPENINEKSDKADLSLNNAIADKIVTQPPLVQNHPIAASTNEEKKKVETVDSYKETVITTPQNKNQDPVLQKIDENDEMFYTPPPVVLEIPNTITPNGDGINDFFEILGIEQCSYSYLSIKNSSGKEIFKSSPYQNNWGSDSDAGVYYFNLIYTINGVKEYRNGILHVIK